MTPIKSAEFQTAEHRFRRFDCTVSSSIKKEDLEDPALWVNVAPKLNQGDEVRVIADDYSFIAYLLVTFSRGTDARLKIISGLDLLEEDEEPTEVESKYDIKLKGQLKYCLINKETGENIKENIPTKAEAYRELDDYLKALSR